MEKVNGIATAVKEKEGKYSIAMGFGNWYNGFGKLPCKKGDKIEIVYEQNGYWKNILELNVLEASVPKVVYPSERSDDIQQMSKLKNKTNTRICALTCATTLAVEDSFPEARLPNSVIAVAEQFISFLEDE